MAITVSYTGTTAGGLTRRWYVWRKTGGGWRKQRLGSYIRNLQKHGQLDQVTRVMGLAIQKGYKIHER